MRTKQPTCQASGAALLHTCTAAARLDGMPSTSPVVEEVIALASADLNLHKVLASWQSNENLIIANEADYLSSYSCREYRQPYFTTQLGAYTG
jgi:hypothetical protein